MICNKCNHQLPDDSEFCQYCGNKLAGTKDEAKAPILESSNFVYNSATAITSSLEAPRFKAEKVKKTKKSKNKKLLIIACAIGIVVITAILLFIFFIIPKLQRYTPPTQTPAAPSATPSTPSATLSNTDEIIAYFKNVEELKEAIKNDPHKYNGKRVSVRGKIGYKSTPSTYISSYVTIGDVRATIADILKFSVLEIGDYIEVNGVISIASNGSIYMSDSSYTFIKTFVESISDRQLWHQNVDNRYVLVFSLRDINNDSIAIPGSVIVKITNDNNEVVYDKTHTFNEDDFQTWYYNDRTIEKYQATIYINDSMIEVGSCANGKITFTVIGEDYSFEEYVLDIYNLPFQ